MVKSSCAQVLQRLCNEASLQESLKKASTPASGLKQNTGDYFTVTVLFLTSITHLSEDHQQEAELLKRLEVMFFVELKRMRNEGSVPL